MTIVSGVVMLILFLSEASNYLSTRTVERMKVDPTLGERLVINFDITFYALHCAGACVPWSAAVAPELASCRPPAKSIPLADVAFFGCRLRRFRTLLIARDACG